MEDGPGRERTQIIGGYPQELPGTQRNHTVESLGETYCTTVCSSYRFSSDCTEKETPYDFTVVAGNTKGCGQPQYHIFFTKEGGTLTPLLTAPGEI